MIYNYGFRNIVHYNFRPSYLFKRDTRMPLTPQDHDLLAAVKAKNQTAIEAALAVGADINSCPPTGTPLYEAVQTRSLALVKFLLEKGAKTYLTNAAFQTPLQLAAENRSEAIVLELLHCRTPIEKNYLDEEWIFVGCIFF